MFIKFGDKTKKKIVKNNKDNNKEEDEDTIYLDGAEDDRRIKILNKYISEESDDEEDDSILDKNLHPRPGSCSIMYTNKNWALSLHDDQNPPTQEVKNFHTVPRIRSIMFFPPTCGGRILP